MCIIFRFSFCSFVDASTYRGVGLLVDTALNCFTGLSSSRLVRPISYFHSCIAFDACFLLINANVYFSTNVFT